MAQMKRTLLVLLARLLLAAVFVLSALPKLQDPGAFAAAVANYRVIGAELSAWVALGLPWLELVLGVGILLPPIRRSSSVLLLLLLLLFIGLHASAWARGLEISCGCFGSEGGAAASDYRWLILRNLGLALAAGLVLRQDLWNKRTPLRSQ